jgi:hypothetical protein
MSSFDKLEGLIPGWWEPCPMIPMMLSFATLEIICIVFIYCFYYILSKILYCWWQHVATKQGWRSSPCVVYTSCNLPRSVLQVHSTNILMQCDETSPRPWTPITCFIILPSNNWVPSKPARHAHMFKSSQMRTLDAHKRSRSYLHPYCCVSWALGQFLKPKMIIIIVMNNDKLRINEW